MSRHVQVPRYNPYGGKYPGQEYRQKNRPDHFQKPRAYEDRYRDVTIIKKPRRPHPDENFYNYPPVKKVPVKAVSRTRGFVFCSLFLSLVIIGVIIGISIGLTLISNAKNKAPNNTTGPNGTVPDNTTMVPNSTTNPNGTVPAVTTMVSDNSTITAGYTSDITTTAQENTTDYSGTTSMAQDNTTILDMTTVAPECQEKTITVGSTSTNVTADYSIKIDLVDAFQDEWANKTSAAFLEMETIFESDIAGLFNGSGIYDVTAKRVSGTQVSFHLYQTVCPPLTTTQVEMNIDSSCKQQSILQNYTVNAIDVKDP